MKWPEGTPLDYFDGLSIALVGSHPKNQALHCNQPRYYGVQYNHSGGLFLRVDREREYRVTGSWAFLTYPGTYFEYGPSWPGKSRWHSYVCFYGPRVEEYIRRGLLPVDREQPLIRIANPGRFQETIETLRQGLMTQLPNPARLTHTLEDLLLQLHEPDGDPDLPYHGPAFASLIDEVDCHPERDWDLVGEARRMGLSPTHFRRLFRQFVGVSPQQYLIQRRMRLAAELLVETTDLVRQIADRAGFRSEFYFSRLFKRTYSLSPIEYRREFATATRP